MKNRIFAWSVISAVTFLAFYASQSIYFALVFAFILAALFTKPRHLEYLGDNIVDAELKLNTFLDQSLVAFRAAVLPLSMFASVFRDVQLRGTNKVVVPYYPIDATTAKDFSYTTGYEFDEDTNTAKRDITIDNRKYVPLAFTSEELARMPALNVERVAALAGQNLAFQVVQDILSVVTHANYPNDAFVGGSMDSDDVVDIRTAANALTTSGRPTPWPETGRGLMVNPTYDGMLLKDDAFKAAYAYGSSTPVQEGRMPRIFGFEYAQSAAIPGNSENLVGFAAYMSAILVAFSPIAPSASVRQQMIDYRVVTDPDTGISFEYRQWGDPDFDTDKRVIECNYGFALGEGNALMPIRSAAAS